MWNGVGPGFTKYQKGSFAHVDEMKEYGFEWDYRRGARPRPTTPDLRVTDLDRDGVYAEIIYGCLRGDWVIVTANPIGAVLTAIVLACKLRDRRCNRSNVAGRKA